MRGTLFMSLERLISQRQYALGVRTMLRAGWLAVCVWCVGLGCYLLWGWTVRPVLLGAISATILVGAALVVWRMRVDPLAAARRLDRHFHLKEQLSTAVEVALARRPVGPVGGPLMERSEQLVTQLERHIGRRARFPWYDLVALFSTALIALGLYVLVGIGEPGAGREPLPLPGLVPPEAGAEQFGEEPPPPAEQGEVEVPVPGETPGESGETLDPEALEAIADALRDQGVTRPAAEALDQGDPAGAADELRALADQADQLSQEARDGLAEALREAADELGGSNPELAERLRQDAEQLQRGGQEAAAALDDLARALEGQGSAEQQGLGEGGEGEGEGQAEQPGQGGGSGNQPAGEQRQSDPSARLGVEGQPVPLDAEGEGEVPAEPSNRPPTTDRRGDGFTRGDESSGERVETGADPLHVPMDERDVVQEYFTP